MVPQCLSLLCATKGSFSPSRSLGSFYYLHASFEQSEKTKTKTTGETGRAVSKHETSPHFDRLSSPLDDCFSPVQGPFFHFRPVYPNTDSPPNVTARTFPPWLIPVTFPHFSCHSSAGSTNTITLSKVSVLSNQARGPDQMVSWPACSRAFGGNGTFTAVVVTCDAHL